MPTNFIGIPTTKGREYIPKNISEINERLKSFPIEKRAAILGTIIEESGGNPLAKNDSGAYQGLLQWGADRYRPTSSDESEELDNQIQYILSTVKDKEGGINWTHGGRGSGYSTKDETYSTFNNSNAPFRDRYRAFSYGYVRPAGKEDSYNNRLKVAKDVLNRMVVEENLSKPKPKKWTPMKFEQRQFPSKYSEGGDLNADYWDSLSIADKAEMMRVAIANGITTLPEIRKVYNKFAEGGDIREKDDDYYDYMVKLADKKAKDWGVDPDILLTRMLNDNEYNYKAFFNMDRKNAMGMLTASPEAHFSDVGKTVWHPTFSNESIYSGKTSDYNPRGTVGGEWGEYGGREYYIPSNSQFINNDINVEKTEEYLMQADPKVKISLINKPAYILNEYSKGGYKPSSKLQKDIATWEGTEMQRNRPFSEMTRQFNATVPKEIQARLQPNQLDALYSYGYNVGMGRLKERVLPTLTAYTQGKASREDVQKAMWATKDSQLRGLARRRNWERAMFGGDYKAPFEDGKIGVQIDPARYVLPDGFFENVNNQINGIEIPQMQFQGGVDVDPETLYKKPVIDWNLFGSSGNADIYNPQDENREDMERLGMVMKMLGRGILS